MTTYDTRAEDPEGFSDPMPDEVWCEQEGITPEKVEPTVSKVIPLTDTYGNLLRFDIAVYEPIMGSVVLTDGEHGTAWQRHYSDGLWHRTGGGRAKTWEWLLSKRNLVLVYEAGERS